MGDGAGARIGAHRSGASPHIITRSTTACLFQTKGRIRISVSSIFRKNGHRQEGDRDAEELAVCAETGHGRTYLKALQAPAPSLGALLQAHLGNNIVENGQGQVRHGSFDELGASIDWNKLDQIAALPLEPRQTESMG